LSLFGPWVSRSWLLRIENARPLDISVCLEADADLLRTLPQRRFLLVSFVRVSLSLRVAELQAPDVVLVKPVALQRVDHDCRLESAFEVSKAEKHLPLRALVAWDQAH
jgi:hypothetical protein